LEARKAFQVMEERALLGLDDFSDMPPLEDPDDDEQVEEPEDNEEVAGDKRGGEERVSDVE
jgi:hypothetical protein